MRKPVQGFPIRQGLLKIRRRSIFKNNNLFEIVKRNITTRQTAEAYGFQPNRSSMICCPFHADRNPSMKVDSRFHCFGCGAYERSSRLRSNEVPGGNFKRRNGLASARWRDQVPTSSNLGEKQSDAGRSRSLFRHWYQQTARNERFQGLYLCSLEWYEAAAETPQAG